MMEGKMYIGRTSAYYEPDDGSLYTEEYWTYSEDKDDRAFVGEVYELSEEAVSELDWWLRCRRMNLWQRNNSFNPDMRPPEQIWDSLVVQSERVR